MSISDCMMNGANGGSDFMVDFENISNGGHDINVPANSRVSIQKTFSRKGCVQGGDQVSSSSENRAGSGFNDPPVVVVVAAADPSSDSTRQSSSRYKRSSYWFSSPKRVLLFFAILSTIGTILLIYLTLHMSNSYENET